MAAQITSIQIGGTLTGGTYVNYAVPATVLSSSDIFISISTLVSTAVANELIGVFVTSVPAVIAIVTPVNIDANGYFNYYVPPLRPGGRPRDPIPIVLIPIDKYISVSTVAAIASVPGTIAEIRPPSRPPFITIPVLPVDILQGQGVTTSTQVLVSEGQLPLIILQVRQNFILTPIEEIEVSQLNRTETSTNQKIISGLETTSAQVVNNNYIAYQSVNGNLDNLTIEQRKNFAAQVLSNSKPKDRRNTLGHLVNRYSLNSRRI